MPLFELWKSWGVEPDFAIGHSVGEYVAACTAGVFTLEEGLHLIAKRARLMQSLPQDGAMLAVSSGPDHLASILSSANDQLSIAAYNSPQQTVISGPQTAIELAAKELAEQGIQATRLPGSHAFHSALNESILDEFGQAVAEVPLRSPAFPIALNLTGELAHDELQSPQYWQQHLRQPVQFAAELRPCEKRASICSSRSDRNPF